ncbi:sigma-E factor regulatory protein RseB domain-containing protein [Nocardiopsis ansamitocini]|uniref:MucB/RseB N-terminal domain-containing protein n=1 Tax=Nocardiopsis ansamitocini TaxID=1670832 RepID=A0A9W6P469_9ACTN|nr:sigma-E factor regulatory protein RseB domain-containing protein [Nocardiopsis ansamitocini]GLU46782.1 hypothetical protein Nans01_11330 [Nocardiopsis ansamitocini]
MQSVTWWQSTPPRTELVEVVHQPETGTLFSPGREGAGAPGFLMGPAPLDAPHDDLFALLDANFQVRRVATEVVGGRAAVLVQATRDGSAPAARFWVDADTGLLLRREVYDLDGELAYSSAFLSIDLAPRSPDVAEPARRGQPWGNQLDSAELSRLREDGWRLPEGLGAGFALVEARSTGSGQDRVVHLSYSEGICLVSVFVQRGSLNGGEVAGLEPVEKDGAIVYAGGEAGPQRMWQADGFVYTVMADAPEQITGSLTHALPSPDGSGFWSRVERGADRLGSWW